jgi:hypothetical protein
MGRLVDASSVIGKIIFGVFKGFEHVALAFNETTDNQP